MLICMLYLSIFVLYFSTNTKIFLNQNIFLQDINSFSENFTTVEWDKNFTNYDRKILL